jgi:hypothetical protein
MYLIGTSASSVRRSNGPNEPAFGSAVVAAHGARQFTHSEDGAMTMAHSAGAIETGPADAKRL